MTRRVTLKDVARHAGVSYQTVSKVLNRQAQVSSDTEARIRRAVDSLGYHPDFRARNLRTQRSRMLGYSWAPAPPDQANPILDQFLRSMMDAAERAGYHILPFAHRNPEEHVAAYHDLMQTGRVDGFVLSSVEANDRRVRFLLEQGFPFVAFGRAKGGSSYPYVEVDNAAGMRIVTEHLIERGHRQIAVLAWPSESRVGADRLQGYRSAMSRAGLPVQDDFIARIEGSVSLGQEAAGRWLDLPDGQRPTAIAAFSDPMAIGAMRAAQSRGLQVGRDIAISGYDDSPMVQYLTPGLTSVRQPIWQVGQEAIGILTRLLDAEPLEESQVMLAPELIVRDSTHATRPKGGDANL